VAIDPLKKVEELGEEALHTVGEFGEDVVRGFQRLTKLHFPQKKGSVPLKRSMTGYETEMFVLDEKGRVDHSAQLLALAQKQHIIVTPEAAKGMIEALCLPHAQHQHTSLHLVENLTRLSALAEKQGKVLYPFGTYPGKQQPVLHQSPYYTMLSQVLGKERFTNAAGTCCGYHQHYTLPRGMFDYKNKTLRYTTSSKVKRTLLDSYNFLTAADPALTCFLQSSPYFQGKYLAKDARMLIYRGGRALSFPDGKFERPDMHMLGELSPYESTLHDMMHTIQRRQVKWLELMHEKKLNPELVSKNPLDFTWNPMKINPNGTLEYRGTDMNFMSNIFGVSSMIKFSLRRIQQDFTLVTPLDIEMRDAFKIEGNMLFIPPHTQVRAVLQPASAYEGMRIKDLRTYMQRFYRFARAEISRFDPTYVSMLEPVRKMLSKKRTVSDEIVRDVKRAGHNESLPQSFAQELALKYAEKWQLDLHKTKALLERVSAESVE